MYLEEYSPCPLRSIARTWQWHIPVTAFCSKVKVVLQSHNLYKWFEVQNSKQCFKIFTKSLQNLYKTFRESSQNLQRIFTNLNKISTKSLQNLCRIFTESLQNLHRIFIESLKLFTESLKNFYKLFTKSLQIFLQI